eukprot:TRINITY_DN4147_c0_g1_i3.p1 TRINITY_DN4147_c0_g1~~TRINITY_DN4147_c0_g1_i3.p1  ORF type:complete len:122 (-),score=35.83 TRINITY_DN4147_c0_g1_i3:55-420(-)
MLASALEHPLENDVMSSTLELKEIDNEVEQCKQSFFHLLDIESRKCLSQVLSEISLENRSLLGKSLNNVRREILENFKTMRLDELPTTMGKNDEDFGFAMSVLIEEMRVKLALHCEQKLSK